MSAKVLVKLQGDSRQGWRRGEVLPYLPLGLRLRGLLKAIAIAATVDGAGSAISRPSQGRVAFGHALADAHNVLGMLASIGIIAVSLTGIVLNHREFLGISKEAPVVENSRSPETIPISEAITIAECVHLQQSGSVAQAELDRAIWRPHEGTVEVRLEN